MGSNVTGFALDPPSSPNLFELAQISHLVSHMYGDIRDPVALERAIAAARPSVVIHLAAQAYVLDSYSDPVETFATNVMGTVLVLETVRRVGSVDGVLIVTSDKCYENREWVWGYRESEVLGGRDPYSASKSCAELVTASFRSSSMNQLGESGGDTAVASARAGNVIGGGDWGANRLIPDMIRAVMAGEEVIIRNPSAIRQWQYVLDPLSGYLVLLEKLLTEGRKIFRDVAW